MSLYRPKAMIVDAHQWHYNGDHPGDRVGEHLTDPLDDNNTYNRQEGAIVRYFRHPDFPGTTSCGQCKRTMHDHGWIDTPDGGHTVCPGDWILTTSNDEYYPVSPSVFRVAYLPMTRELPLSLYAYEVARELNAHNYPFSALIAAAMNRADTNNSARLTAMWPGVWEDLQARYNAPGGILEHEKFGQFGP